jgi:dihydroflavonol-4-reductase
LGPFIFPSGDKSNYTLFFALLVAHYITSIKYLQYIDKYKTKWDNLDQLEKFQEVKNMKENPVLVTGISGFLGLHTAVGLLQRGYRVLGTVRNLDRVPELKSILENSNLNLDGVEFGEADLLDKEAWFSLARQVECILHIASPFPREMPRDPEELIRPAREGVLNVMRAAAAAGVRRVVLVSSVGAVGYGKAHGQRSGLFTEEDWTDDANLRDTTPYFRSKTIAEKAVWEFMARDNSGLELSVVCPSAILGPVLERDFGTSANMIVKMLDGSTPAVPNLGYDVVDVRSVVDLLIRAMELPQAASERFIAASGYRSFSEMAALLRQKYPERKIPWIPLPAFLVRAAAHFEPALQPLRVDLGVKRRFDHSKAEDLLGWEPAVPEEAVLACAESLIELNIV